MAASSSGDLLVESSSLISEVRPYPSDFGVLKAIFADCIPSRSRSTSLGAVAALSSPRAAASLAASAATPLLIASVTASATAGAIFSVTESLTLALLTVSRIAPGSAHFLIAPYKAKPHDATNDDQAIGTATGSIRR